MSLFCIVFVDSGGTLFTITGSRLDLVITPKMILYLPDGGNITGVKFRFNSVYICKVLVVKLSVLINVKLIAYCRNDLLCIKWYVKASQAQN